MIGKKRYVETSRSTARIRELGTLGVIVSLLAASALIPSWSCIVSRDLKEEGDGAEPRGFLRQKTEQLGIAEGEIEEQERGFLRQTTGNPRSPDKAVPNPGPAPRANPAPVGAGLLSAPLLGRDVSIGPAAGLEIEQPVVLRGCLVLDERNAQYFDLEQIEQPCALVTEPLHIIEMRACGEKTLYVLADGFAVDDAEICPGTVKAQRHPVQVGRNVTLLSGDFDDPDLWLMFVGEGDSSIRTEPAAGKARIAGLTVAKDRSTARVSVGAGDVKRLTVGRIRGGLSGTLAVEAPTLVLESTGAIAGSGIIEFTGRTLIAEGIQTRGVALMLSSETGLKLKPGGKRLSVLRFGGDVHLRNVVVESPPSSGVEFYFDDPLANHVHLEDVTLNYNHSNEGAYLRFGTGPSVGKVPAGNTGSRPPAYVWMRNVNVVTPTTAGEELARDRERLLVAGRGAAREILYQVSGLEHNGEANPWPAIAGLPPRNSPFESEMRYVPGFGFVDGTSCDVWPKDLSSPGIWPARMAELVKALAAAGEDRDGSYRYLGDLLDRTAALGVADPVIVGSRYGLTLVNVTYGDGAQALAAVDEVTGAGYDLSRTNLCTPSDIDEKRCEVHGKGSPWPVVVEIDGIQRSDLSILRRSPGKAREIVPDQGEQALNVMALAPSIRLAGSPLASQDVNLLLVADEVIGRGDRMSVASTGENRTTVQMPPFPSQRADGEDRDVPERGLAPWMRNLSYERRPAPGLLALSSRRIEGVSAVEAAYSGMEYGQKTETIIGDFDAYCWPEEEPLRPGGGTPELERETELLVEPGFRPSLDLSGALDEIPGPDTDTDIDTDTDTDPDTEPLPGPGDEPWPGGPGGPGWPWPDGPDGPGGPWEEEEELQRGLLRMPGIRPSNPQAVTGRVASGPGSPSPAPVPTGGGLPGLAGREEEVSELLTQKEALCQEWVLARRGLSRKRWIDWVEPFGEIDRMVWLKPWGEEERTSSAERARGIERHRMELDVLLPRVDDPLDGGVATVSCGGGAGCLAVDRSAPGRSVQVRLLGGSESLALQIANGIAEMARSEYEPCGPLKWAIPPKRCTPEAPCHCHGSARVRVFDEQHGEEYLGSYQIDGLINGGEVPALAYLLRGSLTSWLGGLPQARGHEPAPGFTERFVGKAGNSRHRMILSQSEMLHQSIDLAEQTSRRGGVIAGWEAPHALVEEMFDGRGIEALNGGTEELLGLETDPMKQELGGKLERVRRKWEYLSAHEPAPEGRRGVFVNAIDVQFGSMARGWYQERDTVRARLSSPRSFGRYIDKWDRAIELMDHLDTLVADIEKLSGEADFVAELIGLGLGTAEDLAAASDRNVMTRERAIEVLEQSVVRLSAAIEVVQALIEGPIRDLMKQCPEERFDEKLENFAGYLDKAREVLNFLNQLIGENEKLEAVITGLKYASKGLKVLSGGLELLWGETEKCLGEDDRKLLLIELQLAETLLESLRVGLDMAATIAAAFEADVEYHQTASASLRELADGLGKLRDKFGDVSSMRADDKRDRIEKVCQAGVGTVHAAQAELYELGQILQTTHGYPGLTPYFEAPAMNASPSRSEVEFLPERRHGFGISLWDDSLSNWYFDLEDEAGPPAPSPAPGESGPDRPIAAAPARGFLVAARSGAEVLPAVGVPGGLEWFRGTEAEARAAAEFRRSALRQLGAGTPGLGGLARDLITRMMLAGDNYSAATSPFFEPLFVVRKRLRRIRGCLVKTVRDGYEVTSCGPRLGVDRPAGLARCGEADLFLANGEVGFEVGLDDLARATEATVLRARFEDVFRTPPIVHRVYYQVYDARCEQDETGETGQRCDGEPHRFATAGFARTEQREVNGTSVEPLHQVFLVNASPAVPDIEDCGSEAAGWWSGSDAGGALETCLWPMQSRPQLERIDVFDASQGSNQIIAEHHRIGHEIVDPDFLDDSMIHGLPLLGTWHLVFDPDQAEQWADQLYPTGENGRWPASACEMSEEAPYRHEDYRYRPEDAERPWDLDTISGIDVVFVVGWMPTPRAHYTASGR